MNSKEVLESKYRKDWQRAFERVADSFIWEIEIDDCLKGERRLMYITTIAKRLMETLLECEPMVRRAQEPILRKRARALHKKIYGKEWPEPVEYDDTSGPENSEN